MKNITEIGHEVIADIKQGKGAKKSLMPISARSQNESKLSMEVAISWIFRKFTALYGSRWTAEMEHSNLKDLAELWMEALEGMSGDEIKWAVKEIVQGRAGYCCFAPTAPQFRQVCLYGREEMRAMRPKPQIISITSRPSPDVVKSHIAAAREAMKQAARDSHKPIETFSHEGDTNTKTEH